MNPGSDTWLRGELERLKRLSGLGQDLNLVWTPISNSALSGEVKGRTIYIYEESEGKAVEVLRHEFLDHCVSKAIDPYRKVTNSLIKLVNEDAYDRKEKIVEGLSRILFEKYDEE